MTRDEKILYHQIHPLKLATDWGVTPLALYFFWRHRSLSGLLVSFLPALIASWAITQYADLEPYKHSPLGRYIKKYMTPEMEAVRFSGFGIMALGAWWHRMWLIPAGLAVVLFGWLRGVLFP